MYTTMNTAVAAEHRNDLLAAAARNRRAALVVDDVVPGYQPRPSIRRHHRHPLGITRFMRGWLASGQL